MTGSLAQSILGTKMISVPGRVSFLSSICPFRAPPPDETKSPPRRPALPDPSPGTIGGRLGAGGVVLTVDLEEGGCGWWRTSSPLPRVVCRSDSTSRWTTRTSATR